MCEVNVNEGFHRTSKHTNTDIICIHTHIHTHTHIHAYTHTHTHTNKKKQYGHSQVPAQQPPYLQGTQQQQLAQQQAQQPGFQQIQQQHQQQHHSQSHHPQLAQQQQQHQQQQQQQQQMIHRHHQQQSQHHQQQHGGVQQQGQIPSSHQQQQLQHQHQQQHQQQQQQQQQNQQLIKNPVLEIVNSSPSIRNVWCDNFREEISVIDNLVEDYPFIAIDTEFPGTVARPIGFFQNGYEYHYRCVLENTNVLKLVQLGLTFYNRFAFFFVSLCICGCRVCRSCGVFFCFLFFLCVSVGMCCCNTHTHTHTQTQTQYRCVYAYAFGVYTRLYMAHDTLDTHAYIKQMHVQRNKTQHNTTQHNTQHNSKGERPKPVHTWQFNFKFSLNQDMYAPDSMQFLYNAGIDFKHHESKGIEPQEFAEAFMMSGCVLTDDVSWICFHGSWDFAYLLKVLCVFLSFFVSFFWCVCVYVCVNESVALEK